MSEEIPAHIRRAKWNLTKGGENYVNRLFARWNHDYFGSRLPEYRVRFVSNIRWGKLGRHAGGYTDTKHREIVLDAFMNGNARDTMETLIHEMIHASGIRYHGERFTDEARRLEALGAPIADVDTVSRASARAVGQASQGAKAKPDREGRKPKPRKGAKRRTSHGRQTER